MLIINSVACLLLDERAAVGELLLALALLLRQAVLELQQLRLGHLLRVLPIDPPSQLRPPRPPQRTAS